MNVSKIISLAAVVATLMAPVAASAAFYQDHVIDKAGQPVMDARGNCVLTKWETKDGICKGRLMISREERTIYFDFNQATIKPSEKAKLDALVKVLKGSKEVVSVDIVGFADKIGGMSTANQKLSQKRADAVKRYLFKSGKVKTRKIDIKGLGATNSVTQCDPSLARKELIACLAKDRRVEIELNFAK